MLEKINSTIQSQKKNICKKIGLIILSKHLLLLIVISLIPEFGMLNYSNITIPTFSFSNTIYQL